MTTPSAIYVACDGSALRNPGPAGWGWFVTDDCWAAGGEAHSTNQRMELSAALEFLRSTSHLPTDTEIVMVLDSTYTRDCLTVWIKNWLRNGWISSSKKPVANRDLIEPAYNLLKVRTGTTFQWVKGHANHPLNTKADEKCTAASAAMAAGEPVPAGPGWTIPPLAVEHAHTVTHAVPVESASASASAAAVASLEQPAKRPAFVQGMLGD